MPTSSPPIGIKAHRKPGPFLGALLLHLDSQESRRLYHELLALERDERCLWRGLFVMGVLLMVALAGLGYCALLLPNSERGFTHPMVSCMLVLGLGALISQAVFLGYLLWQRTKVMNLHKECRGLILTLAPSRLRLAAPAEPPGAVAQGIRTEVSPVVAPVRLAAIGGH